MWKPSIKSRKTVRIRKKKRLIKMIKGKDEEIADLQIQLHDFKKLVVDSGEKVISEINKCSRENNNLVEWLKLYDEQIKKLRNGKLQFKFTITFCISTTASSNSTSINAYTISNATSNATAIIATNTASIGTSITIIQELS
jgi:hypothetical protein